MNIIKQMICDEALDLRHITNMTITMITNLAVSGEKEKFEKCLLDSSTKLFSRMFCEDKKEYNYQAVVYYGMYIAKCTADANVKHTTCEFFRAMLSDQKFVQLIMGYLCRLIPMNIDSQHRISKRQYSLQSVIYLFKEYSCDISETLKDILDVAQSKFSYLNKDSPFRKYVDWNLINEIAPQYLCCFADAMNTHTSSHVSSSSGVESFIFLVVLSVSILVLM